MLVDSVDQPTLIPLLALFLCGMGLVALLVAYRMPGSTPIRGEETCSARCAAQPSTWTPLQFWRAQALRRCSACLSFGVSNDFAAFVNAAACAAVGGVFEPSL